MADEESVTYSHENAFQSLGLENADDLRLRADLMRTIERIISVRQLTQTQAAKLLGMDQPRVSALLNNKINLFSADRLLRALRDLGQDVELRIVPAAGDKGQIRVAA